MEGVWRRGALALMSVLMGSVPLASLPQVFIVLLMSSLLMNLDRQKMLLLESVSSIHGVFTTTFTTYGCILAHVHCHFHHSYELRG